MAGTGICRMRILATRSSTRSTTRSGVASTRSRTRPPTAWRRTLGEDVYIRGARNPGELKMSYHEKLGNLIGEIRDKTEELESILKESEDDVSPPSVDLVPKNDLIVLRQGLDCIYLFRREQVEGLISELTKVLSEVPRDIEGWE